MTSPFAPWLSCYARHPKPRQRLICFPHAGGSPSFYRDWGKHLHDCEVHAVCYPGRNARIDEPAATDLVFLARQIAEVVEKAATVPLAFFGHSMGAAVALETARCLESRGGRVTHLFASGSREGACHVFSPRDGDSDDDTIVEQLVKLGGTDAAAAADPIFREIVIPYVRSDTRMFHSYVSAPQPALKCEVTAIVGEADVDADQRPWSRLTTNQFREIRVSGGHFYLVSQPPYALIRSALHLPSAGTDGPRTELTTNHGNTVYQRNH